VGLGIPKNLDRFCRITVDGVDVYLPQGFDTPYPLTIKLHSLFGFKTLHLEGWKLI
jgi:hypothetical protein